MKNLFIVILIIAILGAIGYFIYQNPSITSQVQNLVPKTDQQPEGEATGIVIIRGYAFVPQTITIKVGESVTWANQDFMEHTATADDGSWDTGLIANGRSKSVTFDKAGEFSYHCTPHPYMKGKVIVTN